MKALSVDNLLSKKIDSVRLSDKWVQAIGCPELSGTWLIYGPPKNGKTTFCLQIANELSDFGRVLYNTIEEGFSLSFQTAVKRTGLRNKKVVFVEREYYQDIYNRLKRPKSPKIIIIDSLQFSYLNIEQYRDLKETFRDKLFVYISHIKNNLPDGSTAIKIHRDANVYFRIEGFRAYPMSRYGGGEHIDIVPELAKKYLPQN